MARTPSIKKVDTGDRFYHVRVRRPSRFSRVRTLTSGKHGRVRAARSVGAHGVKVGKSKRSGNWMVQSVLVRRRGNTRRSARRKARRTVRKIEG